MYALLLANGEDAASGKVWGIKNILTLFPLTEPVWGDANANDSTVKEFNEII